MGLSCRYITLGPPESMSVARQAPTAGAVGARRACPPPNPIWVGVNSKIVERVAVNIYTSKVPKEDRTNLAKLSLPATRRGGEFSNRLTLSGYPGIVTEPNWVALFH